jgi:serine/threonine protein kinase
MIGILFRKILKFLHFKLYSIKKNSLNALWLVLYFPLLKCLGVRRLKAHSFFDWHNKTIYFSGNYFGTKVFLKCEVGFQKYLINELRIYKILSDDFEAQKFLPKLVNTFHLPFGLCIAYKFLKAPNLHEYLNDNSKFKNDESSCELIGVQLINIIDHLYKAKVIHRDFRPANLFVDRGNLIIFDFAFSLNLNDTKQPDLDILIDKPLGQHYKPEELKWDDAYSLLKIIEENNFSFSKEFINNIKERINRLTYSW